VLIWSLVSLYLVLPLGGAKEVWGCRKWGLNLRTVAPVAILCILSGFMQSNVSGRISTTCLGGSGTSIFDAFGGKPCKASPSLTQSLYLSAVYTLVPGSGEKNMHAVQHRSGPGSTTLELASWLLSSTTAHRVRFPSVRGQHSSRLFRGTGECKSQPSFSGCLPRKDKTRSQGDLDDAQDNLVV